MALRLAGLLVFFGLNDCVPVLLSSFVGVVPVDSALLPVGRSSDSGVMPIGPSIFMGCKIFFFVALALALAVALDCVPLVSVASACFGLGFVSSVDCLNKGA